MTISQFFALTDLRGLLRRILKLFSSDSETISSDSETTASDSETTASDSETIFVGFRNYFRRIQKLFSSDSETISSDSETPLRSVKAKNCLLGNLQKID